MSDKVAVIWNLRTAQEKQLSGLLDKYVEPLKENIQHRSDGDLSVVSAFNI